ncbi:MAG: hypothetical protein ACOH12_03555 [Parvibaculaceae bacterium]
MMNFVVGAVMGFLVCIWATETTPTYAVASLWHRLELVQQASSAASESYDAIRVGRAEARERDDRDVIVPVARQVQAESR